MNQEQNRIIIEIEEVYQFINACLMRGVKENLSDEYWNKLAGYVSGIDSIEYPYGYREKIDDCKKEIFESLRTVIGERNPNYVGISKAMENLTSIFFEIKKL